MSRQNPVSNLSRDAGLEYTVRESPRAKHVNLKMSVQSGLEIVVPRGYDRKKIPELLVQKGTWLNRTRQRLNQELSHMPAGHFESLPRRIHLSAIDTHYQIEYVKSVDNTLRLSEKNAILTLQGKTGNHELCIDLLDTWLRNTARKHLAPWLRRTSHELGFTLQHHHDSCTEDPLGQLFFEQDHQPELQAFISTESAGALSVRS